MVNPNVANPSPDPFTLITKALWSILLDDAEFCEIVKPGNRIDYTNITTDLGQKLTNDFPNFLIQPVSTNWFKGGSSSHCIGSTVFQAVVGTGSMHLPTFWRLFWIVSRCYLREHVSLYRLGKLALTMRDGQSTPFVLNAIVQTVTHGHIDENIQRGIKGWDSVFSIEIQTQFPRTAL